MDMEDITEAKMVNEFRLKVEDTEVEVDDVELRRFLRARNHNIEDAEEMYRQSLAWRKAIKFDEALTWELTDFIKENFPFYIDGLDKDGYLALYFPIGRWEVRKTLALGGGMKEEMERSIYNVIANILKALDASKYDQFTIVIDLAELTYWKIAHYETVQMVLRVFREYEQNFPERLKEALVINAPWVMNCIFPLVKPLLTGKTMQKVQIFDSNTSKYLPVLLNLIPEESLPSCLLENIREMNP